MMSTALRNCAQIFGLVLFCAVVSAQSDQAKQLSKADVQKRIAEIVRQRLDEGTFTVNGIRAQTRTAPSPEVIKEIKRYGDTGLENLTSYLRSANMRERIVSVELIGLLGGAQIVPPLREVILRDRSATVRELALRWITQAPADLANPIIQRAAQTDPDERVRSLANGILHPETQKQTDTSVPFKKQPR